MQRDPEHLFLKQTAHHILRIIGAIPGLIWLRPKIRYENDAAKKRIRGGAILVSNHVSVLDPLYLMYAVWYRLQRFVCLKELTEGKYSRLIFRIGRCIPIDRENTSMDTMREIVGALKNGEVISIFPEGHICDSDGQMQTFKSGAALMSALSGCPVVPIFIQKPKRPLSGMTAYIGEPMQIRPGGRRATAAELDAFAQEIKARETELEARCLKETKT